MQSLIDIFGANGLIPHGYCLTWSSKLLWLHVLSDALIVISYYSIPVTLVYFVRQRKDLPYPWLFTMFGLFIVACGTTHLLSVVTIWIPLYWLDGMVKAVTAVISVAAALMMFRVVPRALLLRSPAQLEAEVQERKRTEAALQQSQLELQEAQRIAHVGSWCLDIVTDKVVWSDELYHMLGLNPQSPPPDLSEHHNLFAPESWERLYAALLCTRETGVPYELELDTVRTDGKHIWMLARGEALRDAGGDIVALQGVAVDITERKQADEELRIAAIAFETQEGIMITDAHSVILRVNHAFTEITGYTADETAGQTPRLLKSGRQGAVFYAAMWDSIRHTGAWQGEIWNRRKNGETYPEYLSITAVKGADGDVTHYVATMNDITQRKLAEEQIRNLAFYDSLTHLANRRLLNDRLEQARAASKRSGHYCALIFLDLDNFKPLNDRYGHGVGDLLLIKAAHRITSCVREVDTVARFGGDEFVVMLSELNEDKAESGAQAAIVAEKIRTSLAEPYWLTFRHEGEAEATVEHHCAASIGVAVFNGGTAAEDVIKWADRAMYQAKEGGRNRIRFHEALP